MYWRLFLTRQFKNFQETSPNIINLELRNIPRPFVHEEENVTSRLLHVQILSVINSWRDLEKIARWRKFRIIIHPITWSPAILQFLPPSLPPFPRVLFCVFGRTPKDLSSRIIDPAAAGEIESSENILVGTVEKEAAQPWLWGGDSE